jgi:hypothetical protein
VAAAEAGTVATAAIEAVGLTIAAIATIVVLIGTASLVSGSGVEVVVASGSKGVAGGGRAPGISSSSGAAAVVSVVPGHDVVVLVLGNVVECRIQVRMDTGVEIGEFVRVNRADGWAGVLVRSELDSN